ncbi:MAG: antitermination protein NusG [Planctomycetota bacterium]|nr:MAG: antitermination protein NusG [Planctomycetota bacterium]
MVLKLEENPPITWPQSTQISDFAGTWRVAHTKSRNEKALAWQMQKKDISYFLPMTKKVYRKKGRTFRSLLPLFTGYVFFCGDEDDRVEVLRTNRVANIIEVEDQPRLVAELTPIHLALDKGEQLLPHKYIKTGQQCRVTAGPLVGTEGIVVRAGERTRLVLQVDILGQATSVEIATDMIELIG